MKLNNRGWGTKEMILLSCGLLLVLVFVAFSIYKLYHSVSPINSQYSMLERNIKDAAERYCKINGKRSVITLSELEKSGYITIFTDMNDRPCEGYVLINSDSYKPYISCEYYQTKGYSQRYKNN